MAVRMAHCSSADYWRAKSEEQDRIFERIHRPPAVDLGEAKIVDPPALPPPDDPA